MFQYLNNTKIGSFIVFIITFIVYNFTLAPGLMFTDSGELAAAANTLGITHPTGYPLFTILGYIWSNLPIGGSVIYKMNLFSAFWASMTSVIFYLITKLIINNYHFLANVNKQSHSNQTKNTKNSTKVNKSQKPNKSQSYSNSNSATMTNLKQTNVGNDNGHNSAEINENQGDSQSANNSLIDSLLPILCAFLVGFSLTLWSQSTAVEVYTLHAFMLSTISLLSLKLFFKQISNESELETNTQNNTNNNSAKYNRSIFLIVFLTGLSFANHLTTILIVPGLLYFYFFMYKENNIKSNSQSSEIRMKIKQLGIYILPIIFGAMLYLYLPLRSSGSPIFDWGAVSDSWAKFTYHVLGKQYQVWMFSDSTAFWGNIGKFLKFLPLQLGVFGLFYFLIGLVKLIKLNKQLFIFLLLNILISWIYISGYGIHDIDSYFLTPLIFIFITMIFGLVELVKQAKNNLNLHLGLISVAVIINFSINLQINNQANNHLVQEYTENVMNNLEPNAVIISAQWDYFVSAFWYLNKIENQRKDVVLIEKELLRRTWYYKHLKMWYPQIYNNSKKEIEDFLDILTKFENNLPYDPAQIQIKYIKLINSFIDKNKDTRPIYVTNDVLFSENGELAQNRNFIPVGYALKLEENQTTKAYNSNLKLTRTIQYFELQKTTEFLDLFIDRHLDNGIKDANIANLTSIMRYNDFIKNEKERNKVKAIIQKLDPTAIE